jgi:hypothetical protein
LLRHLSPAQRASGAVRTFNLRCAAYVRVATAACIIAGVETWVLCRNAPSKWTRV